MHGAFFFLFVFWSFWKIDFAQVERRKMRLYVLSKPWVTAKLNIEILFIRRYISLPRWLYLPVSSASGYTPFQFGQLVGVSSEWRELNFSSWRGARLPPLPQGEKLQTAAVKVSFNTFSVLGVGQKMLRHPPKPMKNGLVLHKMTKCEGRHRSDSRQRWHLCLLGVRLLKVSSFPAIHLDSLTGSGKWSAVDQVQWVLTLLLCKHLHHSFQTQVANLFKLTCRNRTFSCIGLQPVRGSLPHTLPHTSGQFTLQSSQSEFGSDWDHGKYWSMCWSCTFTVRLAERWSSQRLGCLPLLTFCHLQWWVFGLQLMHVLLKQLPPPSTGPSDFTTECACVSVRARTHAVSSAPQFSALFQAGAQLRVCVCHLSLYLPSPSKSGRHWRKTSLAEV